MSRDELAFELQNIVDYEGFNGLADHVSKLVIDELNLAKGKIALNNYHVGQSVDLSWIDHRLAELESHREKQ